MNTSMSLVAVLSQSHHGQDKIGNCNNESVHLTCFAFIATMLLWCHLLKVFFFNKNAIFLS